METAFVIKLTRRSSQRSNLSLAVYSCSTAVLVASCHDFQLSKKIISGLWNWLNCAGVQ